MELPSVRWYGVGQPDSPGIAATRLYMSRSLGPIHDEQDQIHYSSKSVVLWEREIRPFRGQDGASRCLFSGQRRITGEGNLS
jgi:hypothetical protein